MDHQSPQPHEVPCARRQRALITGASSGVGAALALELAARGWDLVVCARREPELKRVRDAIGAAHATAQVTVRRLDVTDNDDVRRAVREAAAEPGPLDLVVANAGIGLAGAVGAGSFEDQRRTVEVNLLGAMATLDAAAAVFRERGRGHLVGISSVAAYRGFPRNAAYCASKAGLSAYLEAAAAELHGSEIRVTLIHPGYIDTPLNQSLPSRPFLISAERGAHLIADRIERNNERATVPAAPWALLAPVLRYVPTALLRRFADTRA